MINLFEQSANSVKPDFWSMFFFCQSEQRHGSKIVVTNLDINMASLYSQGSSRNLPQVPWGSVSHRCEVAEPKPPG